MLLRGCYSAQVWCYKKLSNQEVTKIFYKKIIQTVLEHTQLCTLSLNIFTISPDQFPRILTKEVTCFSVRNEKKKWGGYTIIARILIFVRRVSCAPS